MMELEEVVLEADELEAIRLADLLDMSHEAAASSMDISRATFGRIVAKARKKIAESIINGKAIRVSEEMDEKLKDKVKPRCSESEIS